jgi:hypothetical protein
MTLLAGVLALATAVVVPAAVALQPAGVRIGSTRAGRVVPLAAGVAAAVSVFLDRGGFAAVLVVPWLLFVAVLLLRALQLWLATPRVFDLVWVASAGYLAVGAVWLLADRLALEPVGFRPPFVQLTAIHFHYAGFIATTLAGCALRRAPGVRAARLAAGGIVIAPPIVAAGFLWLGVLQIAGATLSTAALWLLALVVLRRIVPTAPRPAALLLTISSLAVLAPMLLAVQWAVGHNFGTPALSIPAMARTHGLINAVGFCLAGTAGWRLLAPPPSRPLNFRFPGSSRGI